MPRTRMQDPLLEVKLVKSVKEGLTGSLPGPLPRRVSAVKTGTGEPGSRNSLRVLFYWKMWGRVKDRKVFPGLQSCLG